MADPPESSPPRPVRGPAVVRGLQRAELAVGVALLVVIFALTLTQAAQRHLPVEGWTWTGELARLSLVWLAFALSGYLMGRGEHITVHVVDFVLSGWALRSVWILAHLVVAAACAAFAADAANLVFSGSPQRTPALQLPQSWTYVIPLVGLALTSLRGLVGAFLPVPEHDRDPAPGTDPGGGR